MVKNKKKKGADFTREVKKTFKLLGFDAFRQASSLFPDLIVMGFTKEDKTLLLYFVENKSQRGGKISRYEKSRFRELFEKYKQAEKIEVACLQVSKDKKGHIDPKIIFSGEEDGDTN